MTKSVDELMRLADDASAAFFGATRTGNIEHAESKRAALRSALEEVVRDSERYRWLMTSPDAAFFSFEGMCCRNEPKADIDAAIDAAMQQAPEQEG